ncbi:MAG TPA: YceI family protein [Vicinamibacterales bacterium]|nr:YceI family protein [Vicinamibacterales bacterium]
MRAIRIVAFVTLTAIVAAQAPDALVIDPGQTTITLHVGRAGVLSFAGHDHEVVVPAVQGQIMLDRTQISRSSVSATFDATAMKVTGKGEPSEDVPEVQRVMLSDRVLDVQRYPTITFQSRQVSVAKQSADQMTIRITGDLTLHGVTRPLDVPVTMQLNADGLRATGKTTVQQSQFGIRPVTAGGGTVRVKDEVDVTFSITAKRR